MADRLLQFFRYDHLPDGPMRATSKRFAEHAHIIVDTVPRNPERTVALRKLLEAKDCAVRAVLEGEAERPAPQQPAPGHPPLEAPWSCYRRAGLTEARPYVPGEDMTGITVSPEDTPVAGGLIAHNPDNHDDQWYIAPEYAAKNLEPV